MRLSILAALIGAGLLAGCETTGYASQEEAQRQAEIAARQGASVGQVCFTRNIDGWRELGRNAILIRRGLKDWYKLDLVGSCDPRWAMSAIGIRTQPGGGCITRGDHIETYTNTPIKGSCVITGIHEWNEDAPVPPAEK
ncbi:MAG: hypothetical protein GC153_07255 [Alphaproteobacteria bacterium]|nr:hypothetical protein [Alphaproteobacteria bacterium]